MAISPAWESHSLCLQRCRPIALKHSKGILLKGLLEGGKHLKVEYRNDALICGAGDAKEIVELKTTRKGIKEKMKAKRAILERLA